MINLVYPTGKCIDYDPEVAIFTIQKRTQMGLSGLKSGILIQKQTYPDSKLEILGNKAYTEKWSPR